MLLPVIPYFSQVLAKIKDGLDCVTVDDALGMSAEDLKISFGILALIVLGPSLMARPG